MYRAGVTIASGTCVTGNLVLRQLKCFLLSLMSFVSSCPHSAGEQVHCPNSHTQDPSSSTSQLTALSKLWLTGPMWPQISKNKNVAQHKIINLTKSFHRFDACIREKKQLRYIHLFAMLSHRFGGLNREALCGFK